MAGNTLHVYRDTYNIKTFYVDKDASSKLVKVDWTDWLTSGQSIASVTWEVENGSTLVTVSNTSNTSTVCTAYLDVTDYGHTIPVKCTITDDSTVPEVESRSILVKAVRTY